MRRATSLKEGRTLLFSQALLSCISSSKPPKQTIKVRKKHGKTGMQTVKMNAK